MQNNYDFNIIGIDGGGTRTRGVLFSQGKFSAQVRSGTTRIGAVGVGESCERLLNVISDLCEQGNLDSTELDAVVIGLAGVWLDDEKKRSAKLLKTLARSQNLALNDLLVTSDAELAVEGAFDGGNGIVMIVGTGSIAVGRLSKDKLIRCGGWGIELDDEGSGAWIGREGLTAVVRALDGRGKHTKLTEILASINPSINLDEPRTIVKAYFERAFEYHNLSPLVMKCAEEGDEVCLDIIRRSSVHLVELLKALHPQFKTKVVPVA
ncbi:MAG: BadF/BadG/BcrA/BcrD ATPase family protein, partial [Ignavibacteria bacterium]|nr:BadF/BadG/BcrA/BcrD ATPase family protein [Ignavibacteria bacterium]